MTKLINEWLLKWQHPRKICTECKVEWTRVGVCAQCSCTVLIKSQPSKLLAKAEQVEERRAA